MNVTNNTQKINMHCVYSQKAYMHHLGIIRTSEGQSPHQQHIQDAP